MKFNSIIYSLILAAVAGLAHAGDSIGIAALPAVALPTGIVGQTCPGKGATSFDSAGKPLSCQSGLWVDSGASDVNGYILTAVGNQFQATGVLTGSTFSGTLKCTMNTCGGFGFVNCGTNTTCINTYANNFTHYNFQGYTIGVRDIAVTGVTQVW